MKVVKSASGTATDFAKCNKKVILTAGKSCDNQRDLDCGKSTR